ncbi:neprilysin-11-like [Prorops nasuta]|uniref:neprilysin-11-like n=1 Tax=Prorops nasuta TaxID=863751 RepID=UPI0034CF3E19
MIRLFLLVVAVAANPTIFSNDYYVQYPPPSYKVCRTQKCINIAKTIIEGMDFSQDPCGNFYSYMCGEFKANNPIPPEKFFVGWSSDLTELVNKRIEDILTNTNEPTGTKALEKARALYKMCMDTGTLNKQGVYPILDKLYKIGFPLLYPATDQKFANIKSWQSYYLKAFDVIGPKAFYTLSVSPDIKMSTLSEPITRLQQDHAPGKPIYDASFNAYKSYVYDILKYLSTASYIVIDHVTLLNEVEAMIQFELKLARLKASTLDARNIDKTYNLMTIKDFQKLYDNHGGNHSAAKIDWLELMNIEFKDIALKIDESEKIDVSNPDFFKKLSTLLKDTPPRTIVNYMAWTITRDLVSYGDSGLNKISFDYISRKTGATKQESRNVICSRHANLNGAISYEYVRRYFSDEAKHKSKKIIDHVVRMTEENIKNTNWMDVLTKTRSIEKLHAIRKLIGYPDYYSTDFIDTFYQDYQLGSNYLESIINLSNFMSQKLMLTLRKPYDKTKWIVEPTMVNAFYLPAANSIFVTAAILQSPLFDAERPDVLNYAASGFLAGHEISHAFDNTGRKFDKDGNVMDWWPQNMINLYDDKANCFVEQYNKYLIPELVPANHLVFVNGNLTVGENIADTTGLQSAFNAFKEYQVQTGENIRLAGLEYFTSEQLFFMQYASWQCDNTRSSLLLSIIRVDTHSPTSVRVRGSISNNADFGRVFNCPLGSPMNPIDKCTILNS